MYLGAQRVQDPSGDMPVALHYYVHSPRGVDVSALSDVVWVSESEPGQLMLHRSPGRGGGRRVLSYLDVSGPDGASATDLHRVLTTLRERLGLGSRVPLVLDGFGARFFAGGTIDPADALSEFDRLARELLAFAVEAFETQPPPRALTIVCWRENDRTRFAWDSDSEREISTRAPEWLRPTVSIADDTRDAFEEMHGSFYPHALDALFPLGPEKLRELGGARVVDRATGKTLWFTEDESA